MLELKRNPGLVNIFYKLGFIENYGSGIKRIHEAYPNYDIHSFLIDKRLWFRIILPDLNYKEEALEDNVPQNILNKDLEKIIVAIKENSKVTREELASIIGKSVKTVARIIKDSKIINFVGSSKSGYWKIIETNKKTKDE